MNRSVRWAEIRQASIGDKIVGAPLFHKVIKAVLGAQGRQTLCQVAVLLRPSLSDLALNDVLISAAVTGCFRARPGRAVPQSVSGWVTRHSHASCCTCSSPNVPELVQQRFMSEKIDIFDVIVSLVLPLRLLLGLAWMDAFQDAQTPAQTSHIVHALPY